MAVAHGTRAEAGRATVTDLVALVADRLPGVPVELAWVDVLEPTVDAVLADGPGAVVVPLFLGTGYHVRVDIARAARRASQPAVVTPALGTAPQVIEVLAERLREAAEHPDGVVLAAAGSSDPRSIAGTHEIADQLSRRLDVRVLAAFASAATPTIEQAIADLRADGVRSPAVSSYLLAPGHFSRRITGAAGEVAVSAPLGAHPLLAALTVERYLHARGAESMKSPAPLQ